MNNGESIIRGKGNFVKELIGSLRDVQKSTQRGFGFNKKSRIYVEAPADNTIVFIGRPSKGKGSSFVSVIAQGLSVTKGEFPSFNPSTLWKWVKNGSKDEEIAIQLRDDIVKVGYGGVNSPGYRGGLPKAEYFNIDDFLKKKTKGKKSFSREFDLEIESMRLDMSVSAIQSNLDLMENIEDDYFAFYFIDGRLYMHVKSGGTGEVTRPVNLTDSVIREGDEEYPDRELFDFVMPVSNDIVWTLIRNADFLEMSIPKRWRELEVIQWSFMNKISETEVIQGNVVTGRNRQYSSDLLYNIDDFRNKVRRQNY